MDQMDESNLSFQTDDEILQFLAGCSDSDLDTEEEYSDDDFDFASVNSRRSNDVFSAIARYSIGATSTNTKTQNVATGLPSIATESSKSSHHHCHQQQAVSVIFSFHHIIYVLIDSGEC